MLKVPEERLELFAMSCLLIAAKFYESFSNIQTKRNLDNAYKYTMKTNTPALVKETEKTILNVLSWNLDIQTPYHFVKYF